MSKQPLVKAIVLPNRRRRLISCDSAGSLKTLCGMICGWFMRNQCFFIGLMAFAMFIFVIYCHGSGHDEDSMSFGTTTTRFLLTLGSRIKLATPKRMKLRNW